MRRFYLAQAAAMGGEAVISGADAGHIFRVLRLAPGDRIVVFDGSGFDYESEILKAAPDRIRIRILGKIPSRPESRAEITVAQALLKGKKMDTLVRQMTELGVSEWVPFAAHRSIPALDERRRGERLERWQTIVKEALKQSRRGEFTRIRPLCSFTEMLSLGKSQSIKLIFWENEAEPLEQVLRSVPPDSRSIMIVLGPEGGFTAEEIEAARSHGFASAGLGARILRAETASLAACVLIQHLFGDLGRLPFGDENSEE